MKRLFNIGSRAVVGLVAIAIFFSACLKNNGPIQDYSQSPALVSIQGDGQYNGIFVASQSVLPISSAGINVEITLSVANLTLSTPVTATLMVDQATLDQYKAANSDSTRLLLPADNYQIANNGAVTISPGQQIVKDSIIFSGIRSTSRRTMRCRCCSPMRRGRRSRTISSRR
ncbi:DUF1735 domain-containing protein [Puia sp. P3]|uniref:DUF1735 domain-containing protein n=1 Tax=Puia sp. P3 TaxID=3423952 RepID=UPI003D67E4E2